MNTRTCTSSIYASTYTQMNAEFQISSIVGTLGLSLFVLGRMCFNRVSREGLISLLTSTLVALGPLLMSPMSEFVGRRPIYLASWAMFLIWLTPSAVARNAETMLIVCLCLLQAHNTFLSLSPPHDARNQALTCVQARFLDGFAGSSFLSVAGGTVSDVFRRDQIQAPMVIISLSPFVGKCSLTPDDIASS